MAKVAKNSKRGARPGERRGGRKKGTPNKFTLSLKQAVLATFEKLGGVKHMATWAKESPSDFYRIAARLIPPGVPVLIDGLEGSLATQSASVVKAMSTGEITPEQANTVMQTLAAHAKVVETDYLEKRIAALEAKSDGKNP